MEIHLRVGKSNRATIPHMWDGTTDLMRKWPVGERLNGTYQGFGRSPFLCISRMCQAKRPRRGRSIRGGSKSWPSMAPS